MLWRSQKLFISNATFFLLAGIALSFSIPDMMLVSPSLAGALHRYAVNMIHRDACSQIVARPLQTISGGILLRQIVAATGAQNSARAASTRQEKWRGRSRKIQLRWIAADSGWPKKSSSGGREIRQAVDRCADGPQQATAAIRSGGGVIDTEESSGTGGGDTNNAIAP